MTSSQRQTLDAAVLRTLRATPFPIRLTEVVERLTAGSYHLVRSLPDGKKIDRFVGEALQRLQQAGKVELVRGYWKTSSPTS